jgi:hypothetical protein
MGRASWSVSREGRMIGLRGLGSRRLLGSSSPVFPPSGDLTDIFSPYRYQSPFDRHDWLVDRGNGERVRYVIDFYTGRPTAQSPFESAAAASARSQQRQQQQQQPNLSFYLDVRPALDGWEGARMRIARFWGSASSTQTTSATAAAGNKGASTQS